MSQQYTFTGPEAVRAYLRYRDLGTGSILTGSPGYTCEMAALEEGLPVPPGDGRWVPAQDAQAAAAKPAAKARGGTGTPATPGPEGGEG